MQRTIATQPALPKFTGVGSSSTAGPQATNPSLEKALRDRSGPDAGKISGDTRFSLIADLYLAEVGRRRKPTTYDTYALHMRNHVLPALGDLRVREITVVRIERFLRGV